MPLDPKSPFRTIKQGGRARLPVSISFDGDDEAGQQAFADVVAAINVPVAVDLKHGEGVSVVGAMNVLEADDGRFALTIRNSSDTQMTWRADGQDATATDYPLDPGRGYELPIQLIPRGPISVWCAVAGKRWNLIYGTTTDA